MPNIKEIFSTTLAVITGTAMYILLNWIPIIGPLIVGFIAGFIAKGSVKRRFLSGVLSAIIGFVILLLFVFSKWGLNNILLLWIILLWNLTGIVFAGIGSILGSMISSTADMMSKFRRFDSSIHQYTGKTIRFNICPNCGISNPTDAVYCTSCGAAIVVRNDGGRYS